MSHEAYTYSDEMLNAYLDNELAGEERQRLIEDLQENEGLRQRVCRLEQVRNMVSIAYHDIPEPQHHVTTKKRGYASMASIAAGILVVVGVLGGWFGHSYYQAEKSLVQLADSLQVNALNEAKPWRVLLHVTSDDSYRLNILLNEAESILKEYQDKQQKVAIQILANGKGLNLLRNDKTPYAKRIAELQSKYDNIIFMACAKAMARVQQKTGKQVELLPNTLIAPSAIGEVLTRQRDGWTYIKI